MKCFFLTEKAVVYKPPERKSSNRKTWSLSQIFIPDSSSETKTNFSGTKTNFSAAMNILSEILNLEESIFRFPIELRTLIPDYYKTLNPNYVTEFQSRILRLSKKIEEIESHRFDMTSVLQNEITAQVLNRLIEEGNSFMSIEF